uniref:Uncharacterized protein n=1 Tax=Prolemur simus TaxID=1328070 RepID=A0A8C8Z5P9_PROSS
MWRATGRATVARLGPGLLLLALVPPVQIYSNQTTVVTLPSNSSQSPSAAPNPAEATTKAIGSALLSTTLAVVLLSILHKLAFVLVPVSSEVHDGFCISR